MTIDVGVLVPYLTLANVESWLLDSSHVASYVIVALLLLSSGFGAPIPEDVPLLIGGWLCRQDHAELFIMIAVSWMFVLAGDCVLYFLGRRYGHHVPRLPGLRRVLTEERIAWAEGFFHRHGGKTLFVMRFMPAVRAAIWFSAGGLKIPFWKFITYDGTAALIFVPSYLLLGWFFSEQWERISRVTRIGQLAFLMIMGGAVASLAVWQFIRMRQQKD